MKELIIPVFLSVLLLPFIGYIPTIMLKSGVMPHTTFCEGDLVFGKVSYCDGKPFVCSGNKCHYVEIADFKNLEEENEQQ